MQKNMYGKTQNNWDIIIITVNNYKQKEFAAKEILKRKKLKYIYKDTKIIIRVVKKGFETGSALINLFKKINVYGKKVLYIPSAGKSQRTFYYFKKGKLWITTKEKLKNGEDKTIFDEILENTKPILNKIKEGILICCSDVVIKFEEDIDFKEKDKVYVFSSLVDKEFGTRHGTFKINSKNKVTKVCQKESLYVLEKNSFIENGKVNIDTGMMLIPNNIMKKLKNIKIKNKKLGIYEDLTPIFCKENLLNVIPFKKAIFTHYGSSKEILNLKCDENNNYFENCEYNFHIMLKNVMVFNTRIDRKIPDNVIIYTTRLKQDKFITIIVGIDDNIKAKGKEIKLFNKNLMENLEIKNNTDISLWELKIYKPAKTKKEALEYALELYYLIKYNKKINPENKLSIEEILKKEDVWKK